MSTFSELRDEVLSHQFSAAQYTNYAGDRINEAQRYITAQTDFRELEDNETYTTVSGTASYALPSDFQRVYTVDVDLGDGYGHLDQITRAEFNTNPTSSGRPTQYAIDGSNLKLWPTPDAAYTVILRHYRDPATLSSANDTPEIPAKYHHLLVSYTLVKCFERENDYSAAQYHQTRFDTELDKCKGEVQYDHDDYHRPTQVGDGRTDILGPEAWWF